MFRKLSSISAFISLHLSLGLYSLIIHPLYPPSLTHNGPVRALASCQESVPGAHELAEWGRKEGGGGEDEGDGDWLIPLPKLVPVSSCPPCLMQAEEGWEHQASQSKASRCRQVRGDRSEPSYDQ